MEDLFKNDWGILSGLKAFVVPKILQQVVALLPCSRSNGKKYILLVHLERNVQKCKFNLD